MIFDDTAEKLKGFSDDGLEEETVPQIMTFNCTDIIWDFGEHDHDEEMMNKVPKSITIELEIDDEMTVVYINDLITEELSSITGWCVLSYSCKEYEAI